MNDSICTDDPQTGRPFLCQSFTCPIHGERNKSLFVARCDKCNCVADQLLSAPDSSGDTGEWCSRCVRNYRAFYNFNP
jgi:hypothetical protein